MYFFYYYPVGVDVPRPRIPWITLLLCVGLTALFLLSGPLAWTNRVAWLQFVYRPITLDLLTPLTACFLHGSWMHLLGNLIYLWVFGPALERVLGRLGLLLVFCGTGYLGNLMQGVVALHLNPASAWGGVLGASGAISGLLGFFLVRYAHARVKLAWWAFLPLQGINRTGIAHLPVAVACLLWVLLQVVLALVHQGAGGTAYGAHLGGLLTGLLLAIALGQGRQGRVERLRARAERHLRKGNLHAAVGLMERYLQEVPWDDTARLAHARLLCMVHQWGKAMGVYRRLVQERIDAGDAGGACDIYVEARRSNHAFAMGAQEQRRLAFWLEKRGDYAEAATAYLDLARFHSRSPEVDHALARAATLTITRVGDVEAGVEILEQALREYPDSPWRAFMEQQRRRLAGVRAG